MSNLDTQKPVPHDVAIFLRNLSTLLDKTLKDGKLPEDFLEYDGISFPDDAVRPNFLSLLSSFADFLAVQGTLRARAFASRRRTPYV